MTPTTRKTFIDHTGTERPFKPDWCKRTKPPTTYDQDYFEDGYHRGRALLRKETPEGKVQYRRHKSTAALNRKGHPGFYVDEQNLKDGLYLWFRVVRGDDASPCKPLTKPFTYFRVVGERWSVKVPVIGIRLAYREAAKLAERATHDGRRIVYGRAADARNERVAYHRDQHDVVWVGATLNTLIELSGGALEHTYKDQLPNMDWSSLVVQV